MTVHSSPSNVCAWCGEPAVGLLVVKKAQYTGAQGLRRVARPAQKAPACSKHLLSVRVEQEADA